MHTVNAMRALGVQIEQPAPDTLIVHGKKRVLTPPKRDNLIAEIPERRCGFSPACSPDQTFESRLVGDAGLSRRPMDRVIAPLRKMGANILAEGSGTRRRHSRIRGGSLRGIHYRLADCERAGNRLRCFWRVFLPKARPLSRSRQSREIILN